MVKYRNRNYRRKYIRSGRWSPNIQEILTTSINTTPGTFFTTYTLATNPVQENTTVSQTYTVKNFSIDFYIDTDNQNYNIEDVCAYIFYVPQGMVVGDNYNILHPEYMLNYKFLGTPSTDAGQFYQPFRIKSRMARKLNTGDSIQLYIKGINQSDSNISMEIHGLIRWWTKAN